MRNLLKNKLVHHDSSKYDGYRLTPLVRAHSRSRPQPAASRARALCAARYALCAVRHTRAAWRTTTRVRAAPAPRVARRRQAILASVARAPRRLR